MSTSALDAYTVPTTALQAVNMMLEAIGETPVSTLEDPGSPADVAIRRLGEVNVETQAEGWAFNTDDELVLSPDSVTGEVVLPAGTLRVRQVRACLQVPGTSNPNPPALIIVPGTLRSRLTVRGGKLYDRRLHTFNLGVPVTVDLTVCLDFEDLPEAARWYIAVKAARRLAQSRLVSATVVQFTGTDEQAARIRMEQEEDEATELDGMEGNPHVAFMRQR